MARKFFSVETLPAITVYMDDTTDSTLAIVGELGDGTWFTTFNAVTIDKTDGQTISPIPDRESAERVALAVLWAFSWTRVNRGQSAEFADNA